MVAGTTTTSASSSLSSVSSLSSSSGGSSDESTTKSGSSVRFLCSYGGRILPRHPDGILRYVGGETRVLAVDRAVPFSELLVKLGVLCGWGDSVSLRCQLPMEDLDALVSVTSDEDLANLMEEYDLASRDMASPLKIRAFLFHLNSSSQHHHHHHHQQQQQQKAPTGAPMQGKAPFYTDRRVRHQIPQGRFMDVRDSHQHHHGACLRHGNPSSSYRHQQHQQQQQQQQQVYLVHHGNHWQ